ncbi:hypothetical protein HDU97_003278 [Phlyctochytrium planicorne]|nr:hypothetical protein HDU97_003278 [Phlyctochytrium planicorne]
MAVAVATPSSPAVVSKKESRYLSHSHHIHSLTEWQRYRNNFLSGTIALSTAFAAMHPLDTIKTRMQANAGSSISTLPPLRSILTPDFFRTLGRGFLASVLGAGPQGGLRLSSYEFTKFHLQIHHPNPAMRRNQQPQFLFGLNSISASAISAVVGDLASSIVKVPREVITSRLQTSSGVGPKQVVESILRTQGPMGLFQGFWSTTARDAPFMIILFCTYESFKQYQHRFVISRYPESDDEVPITTVRSTLFGGVSGALAGFLTTPFDVIKTKVMTSKAGKTPSMFQVAKEIVRAQRGNGPASIKDAKVFFTGSTARSIWWFGICSIFFPIYERSKDHLYHASL